MIKILIAFVLGMVALYLFSKFYCFKNSEEWERFKKKYLKGENK